MGTLVHQVMTRPVIYASEDMTLRQLMELLQDNRISGVPVVDDELRLVGVISETDVIRADLSTQAEPQDTLHLGEGTVSVERYYRIEELDRSVKELMSKDVITCPADISIYDAALLFKAHRVHRLVVMAGSEIAGILSPIDIIYGIADGRLELT